MRNAKTGTPTDLASLRQEWSAAIRKDIHKFSAYADVLRDIAVGIESAEPNSVIIKLISKLPARVQDSVLPVSMLSYVLDNRKAHTKSMASQKLQARLARVRRVLARHVTANVKMGYKVTVDGPNGPEEREGEVSVPTMGTYRDFFDALVSAITTKEGEFDVGDLDQNPTPLRDYLEAKAPSHHDATGLFYDWVENNYRWDRDRDIDALSKQGHGFAGTPFTFDYFKDDDALVDTYSTILEDDEDAYTTNDDGEEMLKPADELADIVLSHLENASDVITLEHDQIESGDYFIIRWA